MADASDVQVVKQGQDPQQWPRAEPVTHGVEVRGLVEITGTQFACEKYALFREQLEREWAGEAFATGQGGA